MRSESFIIETIGLQCVQRETILFLTEPTVLDREITKKHNFWSAQSRFF